MKKYTILFIVCFFLKACLFCSFGQTISDANNYFTNAFGFLKVENIIQENRSIKESDTLSQRYVEYTLLDKLIAKGDNCMKMGDYFLSDLYYNNALYLFMKHNISNLNYLAYIYQILGTNYNYLKDYKKAIVYLNKSLDNYESCQSNYVASINIQIAYAYRRLNQPIDSEYFYKKALEIYNQYPDKYFNDLAETYNGLGLLAYNTSDFAEAEKYLMKSEKFFSKSNNKDVICSSLNHLGFFYKNTGNYISGINNFHKVLLLKCDSFVNNDIYSNPEPKNINPNSTLLYALRYKAQSFFCLYKYITGNKNDLLAAYNTFELTFNLVNKSRKEFFSEQSNFLFASSFKETIENALITVNELYVLTKEKKYLDKMYDYSSLGKASLLLKSISDAKTKQNNGVPIHLVYMERKLKTDIAVLRASYDCFNENSLDNGKKLFEKFNELENCINKISSCEKNQQPVIANISFVNPVDIQNKIESDRVFIEYCLTDSLIFIFLIDKSGFEMKAEYIDSLFFENINNIVSITNDFDLRKVREEDLSNFLLSSFKLYSKLILPFEKQIRGKRLLIIPDGKIQNIPFELLVTKKPRENSNYKNADYLIKSHAISYHYSSGLVLMANEDKPQISKFAAIAPDYSDFVIKENPFYPELIGIKLPLLKNQKKEITGAANLLNGETFCGINASKEKFIELLGQKKIIHYSGHALIN